MTTAPGDDSSAIAETITGHVKVLCSMAPDRRPGSIGNRDATTSAGEVLERHGWHPTFQEFDCLDWEADGGTLAVGEHTLEVVPSPYGTGIDRSGRIRIEDGDFPIATANIRPDHAGPLLERDGETAHIEIRATRQSSRSSNVTARRGPETGRVVVIARIDSPALQPSLPVGVELLFVNGEDHYAAPGEVARLRREHEDLGEIALAVNIDGAGYMRDQTSYSTYNLDGKLNAHIERAFDRTTVVAPGPNWFQSDHAIFAMRGRPALAITSEPIAEIQETVFHSAHDTPDPVNPDHLLEIAAALADLVTTWADAPIPRERHEPDQLPRSRAP